VKPDSFKYGSGTGTNFSKIRGEDEGLSGGGVSSGLMSFLKIGDRAAGAIKSGGTTRRAAKMVCLDADHPDIEEFVQWKVVEEQKVAALVAGSKVSEARLNEILSAAHDQSVPTDSRLNPKLNARLRTAICARAEKTLFRTPIFIALCNSHLRVIPRCALTLTTRIGTTRPIKR
jgi:ribonucleoside-diphosphate reductase alpha chain